jgi:hypothetical protein
MPSLSIDIPDEAFPAIEEAALALGYSLANFALWSLKRTARDILSGDLIVVSEEPESSPASQASLQDFIAKAKHLRTSLS